MRVLFLTHRLPYAPNRGDRIRAFHIIRSLMRRADVDVVSLVHDDHEASQAERLRELGVSVTVVHAPRIRNYANATLRLAGRRPLTHLLLDAPALNTALRNVVRDRRPDVVLAYCSGMARFALESLLAAYPLVVDLVDVDSQKWAELAKRSPWPKSWIYEREAQHLSAFEREMAKHATTTLVVNERERDALREIASHAEIAVVPNGVDFEALAPKTAPIEQARLVFCGVMNYTPNVDGVLWFCREVWPLIRAKRPDASFSIVGSSPESAIQKLHDPENGIEVTGTVDDVRPHLWNAAAAVAPLLTARGLQNKVLEALAAGLPAVVSQPVFDGLPSAARLACKCASSAQSFADETLELLNLTAVERRRLAATADVSSLSWEVQLAPLHRILADAATSTAIAV